MFYYFHHFVNLLSPLRLFKYITFRAFCGAGTAFIISLLLGPYVIRKLKHLKASQQIRKDKVMDMHRHKAGTPTMGGILIIFAVVFSSLLWAIPTNINVLLTIATILFMGVVGFADDYLKITHKNSKGLNGRIKILCQLIWSVVIVIFLWSNANLRSLAAQLMIPFCKNPLISSMPFIGALLFLSIVIVGATNAVNLTDGLDGLAIGCSNSVALAYLVMAYIAGHSVFADHLQVPYVPGAGELAVVCGCLLGAGLGFLWFNCHPAKVFMGDTGSLALGGCIAMVAILVKQELVLIIVGGVFVMEALSVVIQVFYFKWTGGKRFFKCAPLHHHFERLEKERAECEQRDLEVVETMITIRFWIISIIFALIGVATLKIR